MPTNTRKEYIIRGRVQLVMFRDFTRRAAHRLGIVGTVRNNEDGSVSVVGEGNRESLTAFSKELHKGPFLARVDSVVEKDTLPTGEFSEFKIVYA